MDEPCGDGVVDHLEREVDHEEFVVGEAAVWCVEGEPMARGGAWAKYSQKGFEMLLWP